MKRTFILLGILLSVVFMSCAQNSKPSQPTSSGNVEAPTQNQTQVTSKELKNLITANEGWTIIDVRTPGEIGQGKIANSLEFNIADSNFTDKLNALDKNGKYVVYCAVGGRSARAQQVMNSMGFSKVLNLKGGYDAWKRDGN